ncbi:MAG TPA: glycine/sarcosine/betaine reductase selenoprotein B family protein [Pyrinomonadaceae bacterium]|nr:glycine/sarcosine/betaine reductase selenoprotein B family protein [Pyrinomonadaceae bacterium]
MLSTIRKTIEESLGLASKTAPSKKGSVIEGIGEFSGRFKNWRGNEDLKNYPFVENTYAPFTPMRRALPMLNLALISSAGAYIDGTESFDLNSRDGDLNFREIPIEVEAEDLLYAAKGYDAKAVKEDRNVLIPVERLLEYEANGVIGRLNQVWWSLSSWIPNAASVAEELAPKIVERLKNYEVQAALLVPSSRLCHQTLGIVAREIERQGIPTMLISVDRLATDKIRPPRTAYYTGEIGSTIGKANWKQYQLRILDEALRWIETLDQPASRKLAVKLETETEQDRGEQ